MRTPLAGSLLVAVAVAAASPLAQQPAPAPAAAKPDDKKDEEKPKEPKWDVTAEFGPTSKVAFDTSEGTWMNVDVSPDGARVVFDLLGDLYVMPIAGSTAAAPATRLTTGPAFDMQPRFSPDGKRIAFTSDRGGLFNIWVMDADGKNPTAVSREEKWWVNSPTWAPDGDFIFARKHFVSTRSLGAGEVWMYPPQRRRRRPGDREGELPEGRRRAGALARRQVPLLQQGRHAEPDLRVQQEPARRHLRDHPPRAGDRPRAHRSSAAPAARSRRASRPTASGWRSSAASTPAASCSCAASRPAPSGRSSRASTRISRRPGRSSAPTRSTRGLPDSTGLVVWGEGKIWRVDLPAAAPAPGAPPAGRPRDPVRRQGRADDHRGGPLPGDGRAGSLPRAHAARRGGRAGRQERRLQRARQAVDPAAAGRRRRSG